MAKAKKRNSSGKTKARRKRAEPEGEHVRQVAPATAVRSFINEVISTKNATSEAGQGLSTATKRAADQGVNVPAARIAARIYSKAKQDAIKGRVLWEDLTYYLIECMNFDKIAPAGLFSAEEGGQKRSRKSKQEELPVDEPQFDSRDSSEAVVTH